MLPYLARSSVLVLTKHEVAKEIARVRAEVRPSAEKRKRVVYSQQWLLDLSSSPESMISELEALATESPSTLSELLLSVDPFTCEMLTVRVSAGWCV
jgi:hypothetical protein